MPATSYKPLAHNERHLKGIGEPAPTPDAGITANDLLEAERQAKNTIDGWLLGVCGPSRASTIIAEYVAATDPADVDPEIADLADLYASSIVWGWYETRNFGNVTRADAPLLHSTTLKQMAVEKAERIESAGKILKADGTVRRLRYSKWEQGPVGGGPMMGKTYFPTPDDLLPSDVPTEW